MKIKVETAYTFFKNKSFITTWEHFFGANVIKPDVMKELEIFPYDRAFPVDMPYGKYYITKLAEA